MIALQEDCPVCMASPGEPCEDSHGRSVPPHHGRRDRAARHAAAPECENVLGRCALHGGHWLDGLCQTAHVLEEVRAHRAEQFARYGDNASFEDGTGPDSHWLRPFARVGAAHVERIFRQDYEAHEQVNGAPTWMHLVREEIGEVFKESDPARIRAELVQTAALCVSWIEKLDARGTAS